MDQNLPDKVVSDIQKDFKIVGSGRVHSWYAWAIVGIVFGMALGVVYIANRSGEFMSSEAATKTKTPPVAPAPIICPGSCGQPFSAEGSVSSNSEGLLSGVKGWYKLDPDEQKKMVEKFTEVQAPTEDHPDGNLMSPGQAASIVAEINGDTDRLETLKTEAETKCQKLLSINKNNVTQKCQNFNNSCVNLGCVPNPDPPEIEDTVCQPAICTAEQAGSTGFGTQSAIKNYEDKKSIWFRYVCTSSSGSGRVKSMCNGNGPITPSGNGSGGKGTNTGGGNPGTGGGSSGGPTTGGAGTFGEACIYTMPFPNPQSKEESIANADFKIQMTANPAYCKEQKGTCSAPLVCDPTLCKCKAPLPPKSQN